MPNGKEVSGSIAIYVYWATFMVYGWRLFGIDAYQWPERLRGSPLFLAAMFFWTLAASVLPGVGTPSAICATATAAANDHTIAANDFMACRPWGAAAAAAATACLSRRTNDRVLRVPSALFRAGRRTDGPDR